MEQFANFAETTLSGGINNSVTSITVASGSVFPSSGNFSIVIDSEIMQVTARSGGTLTVVRGQDGTTAASHTSGVKVALVLTKRGLNGFRSDNVMDGAHASLFTAAKAGRVYVANDSPYIAYDDGTNAKWVAGPVSVCKKLALSNFSWVLQGSATSNETNGAIYLTHPGSATGVFGMMKSLPATPFKLKVNFSLFRAAVNYSGGGIFFYETGSGKVKTIGMVYGDSTLQVQVSKWASTTSFTSHNFQLDSVATYRPAINWFRLTHDGTNIAFGFSSNGWQWYDAYSSTKGTDFTTGPDRMGFFVNPFGGAAKVGMMVNSWEEY